MLPSLTCLALLFHSIQQHQPLSHAPSSQAQPQSRTLCPLSSASSVSQDNRGGDRCKPLNSQTVLFSWNTHRDAEMFKLSSADPSHAALVNRFWLFGGNERSLRFIERCIRNFPTFCLLGPEGTPVSWSLMDQTGEMRMAGTLPEYRAQGLVTHAIYQQAQCLLKRGFPVYSHVDPKNQIMQKISQNFKHVPMPCDWNQWNCEPL